MDKKFKYCITVKFTEVDHCTVDIWENIPIGKYILKYVGIKSYVIYNLPSNGSENNMIDKW